MAKCQRCGRGGFLSKTDTCGSCGRRVCDHCFVNPHGESLCLDCYPRLVEERKTSVIASYNDKCPLCGTQGRLHVFNPVLYRDHTFKYQDGKAIPVYHGGLQFSAYIACESCGNAINEDNLSKFRKAMRAESAGRYDDAAVLYEDLNFLDKAKALRERHRTSTVKQVQVNLNSLLEQIRQGGLVVPYKCPNCRAGITISKDTSLDRLTNCPYCGSTLVVSDIERFLSSIL
jgi:DNA-directed RNA polymerase subunit RPC12/RpoP